jgi:arylsulfatase A-like enzyme
MPARRPNVLFIIADSLRADHVSSYGYQRETTPHLDRLAERGARFTNAISNSVWSLPVHTTLFTGLYPSEHGLETGIRESSIQLPAVPTLAEILRRAGYSTGGFSDNPWVGKDTCMNRGFDVYVEPTFANSGPESIPGGLPLLARIFRLLEKLPGRLRLINMLSYVFSHNRKTAVLSRLLIRWMQSQVEQGKPFFIFANFMDPHQPYYPPVDALKHFGAPANRLHTHRVNMALRHANQDASQADASFNDDIIDHYDASVFSLDRRIGSIISALEESNALENTLVIITADHGKTLPSDEARTLLERYLREPNVKVPLVVYYPPLFEAGQSADEVVELIDLYYTILDLIGLKSEDHPTLSERLEGAVPEQMAGHALIQAYVPFAFTQLTMDQLMRVQAIRTQGWKFIHSETSGEVWYYDLKSDPDERAPQTELGDAQKAILRDLNWRVGALQSPERLGQGNQVQDLEPTVIERLRDLGYIE